MKDNRSPIEVARNMFDLLFIPASLVTMVGGEQPPLFCVEETSGKVDVKLAESLPGINDVDEAHAFHRFLADSPEVRAACFLSEVKIAAMFANDPRIKLAEEGNVDPDAMDAADALLFDLRVGGDRFVAACKIDRSNSRMPKLLRGEVADARDTAKAFAAFIPAEQSAPRPEVRRGGESLH